MEDDLWIFVEGQVNKYQHLFSFVFFLCTVPCGSPTFS